MLLLQKGCAGILEFPAAGIRCGRQSMPGSGGLSLEEAARELRYGCFRQACREEGAGKAAVAHHGGDSAETMLFHLARGTGIRGLGGIAPSIQMDGMQVIRPLLCLTGGRLKGGWENRGRTFAWMRPMPMCIMPATGSAVK